MSTNFYWKTQPVTTPAGTVEPDNTNPAIHIGKRSAAGRYCWDCGVTLCYDGVSGIHLGRSEWHEVCPKCGAAPVSEGLNAGPAAAELGFAKPRPERPRGVRGAASFTWAQDPAMVRRYCEEHATKACVVDEYGRELTGREFLDMLAANCPIEYLHVGEWFS